MPTLTGLDSEVTIRCGDESDAEWFFEMDLETTWQNLPRCAATHFERDRVRRALCDTHAQMLAQPGHEFFIAQVDGERAGLVWFGPRRNPISGHDEGWIYTLVVREEFRKRGLAKQLMRRAESHARDNGFAVIGLSVAVHNAIARELYAHLGYEQSNVLMRKPLLETTNPDCALCEDEGVI